jgi:hypothetical protein
MHPPSQEVNMREENPLKQTPAVELTRDALPKPEKPTGASTEPAKDDADEGQGSKGSAASVPADGGVIYPDIFASPPKLDERPRAVRTTDRSHEQWMALFTAIEQDPVWGQIDHTRSGLWRISQSLSEGRLKGVGNWEVRNEVLFSLFFACGALRASILKFYGKTRTDDPMVVHPDDAPDA